MENKVMISIFGKQTAPGDDAQTIELITEGVLTENAGRYVLKYIDSELTGMPGTETVFELDGDIITLTRSGDISSQLVFKEGQKHYSMYATPYGSLTIGVVTHLVDYDILGCLGRINIDYDIEIEHAMTGSNSFRIIINPAEE